MDDLIEALQILKKYAKASCPIRVAIDGHCERASIHIGGIKPEEMNEKDVAKLFSIGFSPSDDGWDSPTFNVK